MPRANDHLPDVFSVTALNRSVKEMLEQTFGLIWVQGEISNLARPHSGHLYFSLKDTGAQIRCAMFKGYNRYLKFAPEQGQMVLARARIGLYEPRGDYQLIIEHMELAGSGALQVRYEAILQRLKAEGLFDATLKIPLPPTPQTIGIITSPTGAAVQDVLNVLKRRYPFADVIIYPTLVQGEQAADAIAQAIDRANQRRECDVLILCRGGGSIEDLWAFNEPSVAYAIARCELPLVSGVGHETDVTIADFVSDVRAPTPSAAAELVSPDQLTFKARYEKSQARLQSHLRNYIRQSQQHLNQMAKRLQNCHPERQLHHKSQRCDELEARLKRAIQQKLEQARTHQSNTKRRLLQATPITRIQRLKQHIQQQQQQIIQYHDHALQQQAHQLYTLMEKLNAVSPLATLQRGYAIAYDAENIPLRRYNDVRKGDEIRVQLAQGQLHCHITKTQKS